MHAGTHSRRSAFRPEIRQLTEPVSQSRVPKLSPAGLILGLIHHACPLNLPHSQSQPPTCPLNPPHVPVPATCPETHPMSQPGVPACPSPLSPSYAAVRIDSHMSRAALSCPHLPIRGGLSFAGTHIQTRPQVKPYLKM